MAADNFKPTLWEGALLANFHSVSIADVLATKPAEIKGQKVIFNRVAGGTLKDYSGSVDWDDIDTTPVEMAFDKKKYFAFALDDVDKVQLKVDHEKEIKGMKIDAAINKALADYNAKPAELLAGKIDREKLIVSDDGTVSGLDEQMKGLKESYKDLFNPVLSGRNPANPDGGGSGVTAFDTLVQNADSMTAEEVAAQFAAMAKE